MKKKLALKCGFALLLAGSLSAQEFHRFTFNMGTGFITPVGNTSRHLDEGWKIGGGFGINFNQYVGANVELNLQPARDQWRYAGPRRISRW